MVRATYTLVLVRMNDNYWTGCTEASVGAMCTRADYILDRETYPDTLSTSSNLVKEIAVDLVMNMIALDLWGQAGGYLSGFAQPIVMTKELKDAIDRMSTDSAFKGFTTGKMRES